MDVSPALAPKTGDTTVVLTSCQRYDLLARTLDSLQRFNTDRGIARVIVVEDGAGDPSDICRHFGAELIRTGDRVGQMAAIDLAYAKVETPYIFHLEDDWEFYRSGFIEKSRELLESDPLILLVWLRAWNDTNRHPLSFMADDRSFGVLAPGFEVVWHGFTFNPGLRRLSDYKRLGTYTGQTPAIYRIAVPPLEAQGSLYEAETNHFYRELGYRAVILDETGYVRHIGWARHVSNPRDLVRPADTPRNAPCPCGSGQRYKHCHGRLI